MTSTTAFSGSLNLRELQTVQEQLERQREHLSTFIDPKSRPERKHESVAVLTWPGDSTSAIVISRKAGRVWVRTVGATKAPNRLSLCPGLDGAPASELVVHSRFEFSDGLLLELKAP
jgi:hypothetical protein